jgi:hypothetical protein
VSFMDRKLAEIFQAATDAKAALMAMSARVFDGELAEAVAALEKIRQDAADCRLELTFVIQRLEGTG